jgi:predicted nucleic-acid-binding protein
VIAVDTNVLLRLLIADDPAQAAKARQLFDRANADHMAIWVADTVLVELVWTLSRAYVRDRRDIVQALRGLAFHAMREATDVFERGPADFADCLLCAKAAAAGCVQVATFDRGMKGLPAVKLL